LSIKHELFGLSDLNISIGLKYYEPWSLERIKAFLVSCLNSSKMILDEIYIYLKKIKMQQLQRVE